MREVNKRHLVESIVPRLETGGLTRSDVDSLFMLLRPESGCGSILRDIGDSVAHDKRDRNYLHEYANRFIGHMLETFALGGRLEIGVLYPIDDLMRELQELLGDLDIAIDGASAGTHRAILAQTIGDALDGVRIKTRPGFYVEVTLSARPLGLNTRFLRDRPNGVVKTYANVSIATPMLLAGTDVSDPLDSALAVAARAEADRRARGRTMFDRSV